MNCFLERWLLQTCIAVGCLVTLTGGLWGIIQGAGMLGNAGEVTLDSHVR